jgi:sulfonate transport system substrate-binding protein
MENDMTFLLNRRKLLGAGAAIGAASVLPTLALSRTTDTVRLGWGKGSITYLAKERGEFEKRLKDQGIRVEWVGPFPNHAPSLQAVVGGSADFGFWGSTTPALAAIIAGSPLVFTQFLVYAPRSTAIIVKKDSGIEGVKDLVGKRVAVNRSGLGEFLVVAALEQNGINREQTLHRPLDRARWMPGPCGLPAWTSHGSSSTPRTFSSRAPTSIS